VDLVVLFHLLAPLPLVVFESELLLFGKLVVAFFKSALIRSSPRIGGRHKKLLIRHDGSIQLHRELSEVEVVCRILWQRERLPQFYRLRVQHKAFLIRVTHYKVLSALGHQIEGPIAF